MKKIQLTVEVPDDLDSIDHLELYVNQLGQKIKREILSSLLSQIIDRHKQSELDSSACPDCKKKTKPLGRKPSQDAEDHFRSD